MSGTRPDTDEIAVPHRPAIPGLRFRHFRGAADFPGMVAANQATRDDAGIEEVITVDSMANRYGHLVNSDPDDDILIVERDERIVAYARVEWRDLTDGTRSFVTVCLLHPSERRQGIGRAMLGWSEGRLATKAANLPDKRDVPSRMQAFTLGGESGSIALLEGTGWVRDGHGYEMVRSTLQGIPQVPLPAGLDVRTIGTDEASRGQIWDALIEAFRDHRAEPEQTGVDRAAFLADPIHDPSLWIVAFDGAEVAGGVLGTINPEENRHHGRDRGIVGAVFTRRPWRRRGLARALIARSLETLRERRMTSAYLGVDGENPNQAMTLYHSLGFEIETTSIDWTKPLPNEPPPDGAPPGGRTR